MTPEALDAYLREHIPLTRALGVKVQSVGEAGVELEAPLEPNRNHRNTAFGGSVGALAVLAGWGWLRAALEGHAPLPQLVIQRQELEFLRPIDQRFSARCAPPAPGDWERFSRMLAGRGRGRIELAVDVTCRGETAARFRGTYVAIAAGAANG